MPCGFDLDRTRIEAGVVTGTSWWARLPAARTGRAWLVDGSSYVNRPGPRLVDGLEILAHILQPALFPKIPAANDAHPVSWWRSSTRGGGTRAGPGSSGRGASGRTMPACR